MYYALLIHSKTGPVPSEAIQKALGDQDGDWLRLTTGQYLFKSDKSAFALYDVIKPVLRDDDVFLITEVNLRNRKGFVVKIVRDWMAKHGF